MIQQILIFIAGLLVGGAVIHFREVSRLGEYIDHRLKDTNMFVCVNKECGRSNTLDKFIDKRLLDIANSYADRKRAVELSNKQAAASGKDVVWADCIKCGFTQTGAIMCANVTNTPKLCRDFRPIEEVPEPEPDYPFELGVRPLTFDDNEGADNG